MRVKTVLRRTIQIAEPALGREELEAVREVFECMHAQIVWKNIYDIS